eukprot:949755-Pyramimonas_sp.AAC.1
MGPRRIVLGGRTACGHGHWRPRWGPPGGHKALYWAGGTRASAATEALGGAPHGAAKRCVGWGEIMWTPPLTLSVGPP